MMEVLAGVKSSGTNAEITRTAPLGPYRSQFFSPTSYWKRRLPTSNRPLYQDPVQPLANSANWVASLCTQMGFDPTTPNTSVLSNYLPGHWDGQAYLGREAQHLYIVGDDQPYRPFTNITTNSTPAAQFNALINRLGGLPVPIDVTPHSTDDRYLHIYQPSRKLFASLYECASLDPAVTTVQTSSPVSTGTVKFRLWYGDNFLTTGWWTTADIALGATAAQVVSAINVAKNAGNVVLNSSNIGLLATGGPLGTAPITLTFPVANPLNQVLIEVVNTTYTGNFVFTTHPAGPIDRCRGGGIICADPSGFPGVSAHGGTYSNRIVAGITWESNQWGAAATGTEFMAGHPSYDEYADALNNNTDLGHAVVLNVGDGQHTPIPWVYPAIRADGTRISSPGFIGEGARVAFPEGTDWSYVQAVYPEWMPMALTLERYGCIIPDRTHSGCGLNFRRASWPDSTFNPWYDLLPAYATQGSGANHTYMRILGWHRAEIIDPDFNR